MKNRLVAAMCLLLWLNQAWAQSKSSQVVAGSLCSLNSATETIQQQIDLAKLILRFFNRAWHQRALIRIAKIASLTPALRPVSTRMQSRGERC
jgi:hypothetical protein